MIISPIEGTHCHLPIAGVLKWGSAAPQLSVETFQGAVKTYKKLSNKTILRNIFGKNLMV